jgi:hypothetical protein
MNDGHISTTIAPMIDISQDFVLVLYDSKTVPNHPNQYPSSLRIQPNGVVMWEQGKGGDVGQKEEVRRVSSRMRKSCSIRFIPGFAVVIIRRSSGYIVKGPSVTWEKVILSQNLDWGPTPPSI